MSYSEKLYRLPRDLITIFRNYEAIKRKEINDKRSAKFNETCISENLWPKFTNYIKMYRIQYTHLKKLIKSEII